MLHAASVVVSLALIVALSATPAPGIPVCTDQVAGVSERCPDWVATYNHTGRGGRGEDIARDIAVSPDGATVFVTGESRDDATLQDQAVVAFDAATGARKWASRLDQGGAFDTGSAIAVAPDGSLVFATGRSVGESGSFDWVTAAYRAATGERVWTARHATPAADRTWSVTASPDGAAIYVVGEVGGNDLGAVAYDAATGAVLWEGRYDSGGQDWAIDGGVSPDGATLYASGTSGATGAPATNDLLVVAFRTSAEGEEPAGSLRWVRELDGGDGLEESFGSIEVGGPGVAVGGFTEGQDGTERSLTALLDHATGEPRWVVRAAGLAPGGDQRDSVALSDELIVRTSWRTQDSTSSGQFATTAYRVEDGSVAWSALQGSEPTIKDSATTVAFDPAGRRVFVTGFSVPSYAQTGNFRIEPGHITTVAYDADDGARRWVTQHNQSGVGADVGTAIVTSPDGERVYVAGTFVTSGVYVWASDLTMAYAYDFGVLAYAA